MQREIGKAIYKQRTMNVVSASQCNLIKIDIKNNQIKNIQIDVNTYFSNCNKNC